ncbi:protein kinase receptor Ret oncogene [Musca autumnalis]|uniref:protein kinase receptor Ret oncogene n=1 Tax=Musca autumnalis TaxID=221902 RepID=UPI003CEDE351
MTTTMTTTTKCSRLKLLITLLVFVANFGDNGKNTCKAFDVYFPMTAIELNMPFNEKSQSIFSKIPIGQFQVLSTTENIPAMDYNYSMEANDLLRINETSGEVFLRDDYKAPKESNKFIIKANKNHRNYFYKPTTNTLSEMSIELHPLTEEAYCEDIENICFWSSANYIIMEDLSSPNTAVDNDRSAFKPILVGSLNPRGAKYLCPYMDLKYQLLNASNLFQLRNNLLITRQPLDFESLDVAQQTNLSVDINCLVKINANRTEQFRKLINLQVIDRNDNGPVLLNSSSSTVFNFHMDSAYFNANENIGEKILFMDKDSVATNVYQTYKIINDTLDIVRPVCNVYEGEYPRKRNTMISCQIRFARNGVANQPSYCFALQASDKTIEGTSKNTATAKICIKTDPELILEANHPQALPLRTRQNRKMNVVNTDDSELLNSDSFSRTLTRSIPNSYPKDVYVYRTAQPMYRVTQPADFRNLIRLPQLKFTLIEDRSQAFGITSAAGIIYVKDIVALKYAPETIYFLNVTWHDIYQRSFVINIHLMEGRPNNVTCEHKVKSKSQTCAQIKYRKQCQSFCGLGTNGGSCIWRGTNSARFSSNYASCVPNATFCPDNVCDPLEEINTFVCPQDCTGGNKILSPLSVTDKRKGISSASGTCTCDDNGNCACTPLDEDEPKPKKKKQHKIEAKAETNAYKTETTIINSENPPATTTNATLTEAPTAEAESLINAKGFECNQTCVIIAIVCPSTLLILILCLLIMRLGKHKKSRTMNSLGNREDIRKSPMDPSSCSEAQCGGGAVNGSASGDGLPLVQLENSYTFHSSVVDSKWEFPRENLALDCILGEGEFGKVMKAYATDIANIKGTTTVAVKMLKKGANSVEYMALLSEFQLLQEVSHPNVIKLLGACTKGDTPLIIIEYCKFGALRSYLRLCRKLEYSGAEFTDGMEPMTVRSILSFAWQICKGMSYLTDIKLVHRDLAARNVLLAEGHICKISDFGLTRDVYEDDAYLKRSRERVPVKWMAPESLADNVYTSKSDVWAFGVLCWELITLGASPYPGIPVQNLYHLLKSGYRMEKPENCSDEIYSLVQSCWMDDPNARPSFKYLASEFEKLMSGGHSMKYNKEAETKSFSNPAYGQAEEMQSPTTSHAPSDFYDNPHNSDETSYTMEDLWKPPKVLYDIQDCSSRDTFSFSSSFLPPPGYDMPRPLNESRTIDSRYENDLRFPMATLRKSSLGTPSREVYTLPVKRGRSYMDVTAKANLAENCDKIELSKTISFKFSTILNMQEQNESTA